MFEKRADAQAYLTANCDCWKGKEEQLKALDDATVVNLANDYAGAEEDRLVVNALREELQVPEGEPLADALKAKLNAGPDDDDNADDDADDDDDEKYRAKKGGAVTNTKAAVLAALNELTEDELLGLPAMRGVRERDQLSQNLLTSRKAQVVAQLTANISDPKRRKARADHLSRLTLNELEDRLQDVPAQQPAGSRQVAATPQFPSQPLYLGAGPASTPALNDDEFKPEGMPRVTINWAEEKKQLDSRFHGAAAG